MPILESRTDREALTTTVVARSPFLYPAYGRHTDPRQLERFWGPPGWPATFVRHDFVEGGRSEYYVIGPNGEQSRGFFEFLAIDEPHAFEVRDGFLAADGTPAQGMPTMHIRFTFEPHDGGTRMVTVTTFPSRDSTLAAA